MDVSAQSCLCMAATPSTACHALLLPGDSALEAYAQQRALRLCCRGLHDPLLGLQQSCSQEGMQRLLQQGGMLPALNLPGQWG